MIILMAGLPGSGKSTLARELAARTSGRVIGKDAIRHAIFAKSEIEYSTRQDDFCLQVMLEIAGFLLEKNRDQMMIFDGRTFSRRYQIENVIAAAEALDQPWRILECVCTDETARRRIEQDAAASSHAAGNRDFHLYQNVKARFEAISQPKTVIHTDQALETCVQQALAVMR